MSAFQDLTGQKFNHLTARYRGEDLIKPNGKHRIRWWCECDCGNPELVLVLAYNLKNGHTSSCGCRQYLGNPKPNHYDLSNDYGIGWTNNGEEFLFDKEDYELIKDYTWFKNPYGYIFTHLEDNYIYMHRLVTQTYNRKINIDHINHCTSDNRKENLRACSMSQNQMNKKKQINNTSGYTGVQWYKSRNKWRAVIEVNKKVHHLGYFDKKEDAIKARKEAEEKYFGEWSYDNSMK